MTNIDSAVSGTLGGRIAVIIIGVGLISAAGIDNSAGAFEVTQVVMGAQLLAAGCLAPFIVRRVQQRTGPPTPPEDPSDEYGYIAYLESEILDMRASIAERDEVIDTVLAGLQSSASGVAYTAGRLRGRLDRGVSRHTS